LNVQLLPGRLIATEDILIYTYMIHALPSFQINRAYDFIMDKYKTFKTNKGIKTHPDIDEWYSY